MPLVLSHISALDYWLSKRPQAKYLQEATQANSLIGHRLEGSASNLAVMQTLKRPIDLLVADASLRCGTSGVASHVWSHPLPDGTVFETGEGFYVVSAELAFLQVAKNLELIELIRLGFVLCGTYDLSDGHIKKCAALTSLDRLESTVALFSPVAGSGKAARALRYLAENSASPMETALVMLLCLPYSLGGYGLPYPLLNCRIDLNISKDYRVSLPFYICDLYWPDAQIALEYDSDEFHVGADRIAYDSNKRSDLATQGITVITVTRDQLMSLEKLSVIAHIVAKCCHKRLRFKQPNFSQAHVALRKSLFKREDF